MIEADKVFNPDDFKSMELSIEIENSTTGWKPAGATKRIALIEIGEGSLVLDLPSKSGAQNHNMLITISALLPGAKKFKEVFSSTAKIVHTEQKEDSLLATIELLQFEEKQWEDFQALFTSRQDEISKFLESVRG